jgi:DNA-binding CsgD family transcriptional regulator
MTDDKGNQRELRSNPAGPVKDASAVFELPRSDIRALFSESAEPSDGGPPLPPTHTERFELGELWTRLCGGEWRISDSFSAAERCYLVVAPRKGGPPRWPSRGRALRMIERVLLGESPKEIAIDMRLSASTVASAMKRCLELLGLRNCHISGIPILLVLAARAHHSGEDSCTSGFIAPVFRDESPGWVVSAWRPDLDLPTSLSLAEQTVLRRLIEGRSHTEIANLRGTSTRTVANQLSTVFRKLNVSGRAQAVDALAARALSSRPSPPNPAPPSAPHVGEGASPATTTERSLEPKGFSQSGFLRTGGAAGAELGAAAGTADADEAADSEALGAVAETGGVTAPGEGKRLAAVRSEPGVVLPLPAVAAARGRALPSAGPPADWGEVAVGVSASAGSSASSARSGDAVRMVALGTGGSAGSRDDWVAK